MTTTLSTTVTIATSKTMRKLFIDIETYSDVDLTSCGVYKYVDSPHFEINLFGYAYDDDPVTVIDLAQGETLPPEVLADLTNPDVLKLAHNANFERTCMAKYFARPMDPHQWECTAVRASTLGLPRSLADVGEALGLSEDEKKMAIGKRLIQYFAKPCEPTKAKGGRTRNLPRHEPGRWNLYKEYNAQDVATERTIYNKLLRYPATLPEERSLWALDQIMNEGGVLVDTQLVGAIINYAEHHKQEQERRAMALSGIDNPNSLPQIRRWLASRGIEPETLDKEGVAKLIEDLRGRADVADIVEFLSIRQELGKTSVTKYDAMARALCSDNRIRGMLQFYGANRTGRWAGRIVQLQNLPQNHIKDLDGVRNMVKAGDFELIDLLYPSLMDVFSQLIRTAFIARDGRTFAVADYSAIEARVIAWLAGESWRLEVFKTHGKIYEASYSQAFGVPIESVKKGSIERKKGKIMELALGYGGGISALKAFGADEMGLSDDELQHLVDRWRKTSPRITMFWTNAERSAKEAIAHPGVEVKLPSADIRFKLIGGTLFIKLPSGRAIAYQGARLVKNGQRTEIRYMGQNQKTQKWEEIPTYGGKLVENITQATARDCLGAAMLALHKAGYTPQFHIHDEVVIEVDGATAEGDLERIEKLMQLDGTPWIKGLPLIADGYLTPYYKKD